MKRLMLAIAAVAGVAFLATGTSTARAEHRYGGFGNFRPSTISPYAPGPAYGGRFYSGFYPGSGYGRYGGCHGGGYGFPGYGGYGYRGPYYGGIRNGFSIQTPGFGLYLR